MRILIWSLLVCVNVMQAQDSIVKTDVHQAAKLLNLKYTDKEVDMMLPDLRDNLIDYQKMHLLPLNNNVSMSMMQKLTPDNSKQTKIKWSYSKKISASTSPSAIKAPIC